MIDEIEIINFTSLQERLMKAFFKTYPSVRDFDWLLDFPKSGTISINNQLWEFIKHGKGLRFTKKSADSEEIVDIHSMVMNPKIIDVWRLSQYFPSLNDRDMIELLDKMVQFGTLREIQGGQYELV